MGAMVATIRVPPFLAAVSTTHEDKLRRLVGNDEGRRLVGCRQGRDGG
jgi:hypothetical protein